MACYEYMVTEVGKQRVLNPPGHKPISNVDWKPLIFTEKVQERVSMYLSEYLQSKGVLQKFRKIKDEIASFYQKVSSDLSGMEIVWTEHTCKTRLSLYNDDPEISKASVVGIVLATSPLWLPLLATGVGLTIAASPIIFPVVKRLGRDKRKEKLINEEYDRCLRTVKDFIRKELESNQGKVIYKLLDKVTEDLVNRRMQSLKVMIKQLNKSCKQILSNMKGLDVLAEKIKIIEGSATELLDSFNQEVKAVETGMF